MRKQLLNDYQTKEKVVEKHLSQDELLNYFFKNGQAESLNNLINK